MMQAYAEFDYDSQFTHELITESTQVTIIQNYKFHVHGNHNGTKSVYYYYYYYYIKTVVSGNMTVQTGAYGMFQANSHNLQKLTPNTSATTVNKICFIPWANMN